MGGRVPSSGGRWETYGDHRDRTYSWRPEVPCRRGDVGRDPGQTERPDLRGPPHTAGAPGADPRGGVANAVFDERAAMELRPVYRAPDPGAPGRDVAVRPARRRVRRD